MVPKVTGAPRPPEATGRPTAQPGRLTWVFALALIQVALTLATATLVGVAGPSEAVRCSAFPACIGDQATLVATIHQAAAAALLLLGIALVVLTVPLRSSRPCVFGPAVLGLVVLLVTAIFGMLFAQGTIPTSYAPIQYGFLAVVVILYALTARNARRRRAAPSLTGTA